MFDDSLEQVDGGLGGGRQVDSTAVIRIQKNFNEFMSNKSVKAAPISSSPFSSRVAFDSSIDSIFSNQTATSSVLGLGGVARRLSSRLEADLITAKSSIVQLQNQLDSTATSNKRVRIEYENEVETVRKECERELSKISDLKHEVKVATDKEKAAVQSLFELQARFDAAASESRQKVLALQSDMLQLQTQLQDLSRDSSSQINELKTQNRHLQMSIDTLTSDLANTNEELEDVRGRLAGTDICAVEAEDSRVKLERANQRVHELELALSRVEEDAIVVNATKTQLSRLHQLESDNKRLRDENQYLRTMQENVALLRVECEGLRQKYERAEARCSALVPLEIQHENLLQKLAEWESLVTTGTKGLKTPNDLKRHLAELQCSNQLLLEKNGQVQASIHSLEEQLNCLGTKYDKLSADAVEEQAKLRQSSDLAKRLQLKLLFVSKERDSIKSFVSSFESDLTMSKDSRTMMRLKQMEEELERHRRHIEALERELDRASQKVNDYRRQSNQLEQQFERGDRRSSTSGISVSQATSFADQKIIVELRDKVVDLEKRLETMADEKETLAARLEHLDMQGEYDRSKIKVIHYRMNPYSIAQHKMTSDVERLTKENATLAAKIKLLEDVNNTAVADLTTRAEELGSAAASKELQDVKAQLTSAELKNKRLMEAFKETSQELREVTYQLLGYRIDIPTSNKYRITSMYAESPDDFFLFNKVPSSGELQMLANDYSASFTDKCEEYLTQSKSIPAFLSSITLDLFARQTMLQ